MDSFSDPEKDAEINRWRSKYQQAVRELDHWERNFHDTQESLYRSVLRLTRLASAHPQKDQTANPVQKLRDFLKTKPTAAQLEEHINRMDGGWAPVEDLAACRRTAERLLHYIDQLGERLPGADETQKVRKRLKNPAGCDDNALAVDHLITLVDAVGFQEQAGARDDETLREQLGALATELNMPAEPDTLPGSMLHTLYQYQDGTVTRQQCMSALAESLAQMHRQSRATRSAIDQLLSQLGQKLSALQDYLHERQDDGESSAEDERQLHQNVMDEIAGLATLSADDTPLEQIRHNIERTLEGVREQLARHHERSRTRHEKLRRQTDQLKGQVKKLKSAAGILQKLAHQATQDSLRDPLTRLHNRRALDNHLTGLYRRWLNQPEPLAMVFIDIDRFQNVNHAWGHLAGDKALTSVARLVQSGLRAQDYLARYGGDEFVVILPNTTAESAFAIAEEIRARVAKTRFHVKGNRVPLTVSCGISALRGTDSFFNCLKRADQALDTARRRGYNCSVLHPDSGSQ